MRRIVIAAACVIGVLLAGCTRNHPDPVGTGRPSLPASASTVPIPGLPSGSPLTGVTPLMHPPASARASRSAASHPRQHTADV